MSQLCEVPSVHALVRDLKASNQDYEWYPTTPEIIACVKEDLHKLFSPPGQSSVAASVLDCGAGDGRVLNALTEGSKYAIEKAVPLLNSLDKSIFVVGTDFNQQALIDKRVDAIYSNPPYSEFEAWATKIIREANAAVAYLVIPDRWESSALIASAIEGRHASTKIIGRYSFTGAERKARANVHVVRVQLAGSCSYETRFGLRHSGKAPNVDPFSLWFDEHFSVNATQNEPSHFDQKMEIRSRVRESLASSGELIAHKGLARVLEDFYRLDLNHLMKNYMAVGELDAGLLYELGVNVRGLQEALRLKITSLKDAYWHELFANLSAITDRLASGSRKRLLEKLTENTHVDFSAENAHAIVMWAIKNANAYFETQLVETFKRMTEKANVAMYQSNKRTFGNEDWRYLGQPEGLDRYALEYRVVLSRVGGLCTESYLAPSSKSGLSDSAANFINDLSTIAYTIGFDTFGINRAHEHKWESNKKVNYHYRCPRTGKLEVLFETKAFMNGNIHIRFSQDFIMKLNVEAGRILGWVKSAPDAARELNIPLDEAEKAFGVTQKITIHDALRLVAP